MQLELSFKVVDEKEKALEDVTIKIKNDQVSEELKTDDKGVTGTEQSWSSVEWSVSEIGKNYVETGTNPNEYRCKICSKISGTLSHATEHALTRHLAGRSKCPLCTKISTRKTLQIHVGKDHNMSLNIYSMKVSEKQRPKIYFDGF